MMYRYNRKTLQYVKVNQIGYVLQTIGVILFIMFVMGWSYKQQNRNYTEDEIKLIVMKQNTFSEDRFIEKLRSLNFRFPYIVYAQAKLETGDFSSKMFKENNNLFGMKEATKRINTARGTQNEHAYYETWMESLYDFALYSATYLSDLRSEHDYFDYLGQFYAEDKDYVNKLKALIEREHLKSKLN